jgi:hypothetical protein
MPENLGALSPEGYEEPLIFVSSERWPNKRKIHRDVEPRKYLVFNDFEGCGHLGSCCLHIRAKYSTKPMREYMQKLTGIGSSG